MRRFGKSTVLSMAFLVGAAIAANADPQYRPSSDPQLSAVPSMAPAAVAPASRPQHPASWYYDPYTSSSTVCAQGGENGGPEQCKRLISPAYPMR
jgi:hypothetical protein